MSSVTKFWEEEEETPAAQVAEKIKPSLEVDSNPL